MGLPNIPAHVADYFGAGVAGTQSESLAFLARHQSLLDAFAPARGAARGQAVGEVVDGFLLTRWVGGGMAEVYEGADSDGRVGAIKMSLGGDAGSAQSVVHEADVLLHRPHPHLVEVLSRGQLDGREWFRMPWLDGGDLASKIARSDTHPVALAQAVRWMLQVSEALGSLHASGFVHRDVKPGNIVLHRGDAYLVDLGLVDQSAFVHGIRQLAGTIPYLSPEQTLGGLAAVEPGSDVYSLAASFFEVLTGVRIAEQDGRERMLEAIAFGPRPSLRAVRRVPVALHLIFARALEKDPRRRYPDAGALAEDLRAYRDGEELRHVPEQIGRRTRRFAMRHPRSAVVGLLVAVWITGWALTRWSTTVARQEKFFAALSTPLQRGDYGAAVAVLRAGCEGPEGDEVVGRVHQLLRRHRDGLGRAMTQELLQQTGFAIDGVVERRFDARRTLSARLLEELGGHDFLLQHVWGLLHRNRVTEAFEVYRDRGGEQSEDPRIVDLGLILAQQLGRRDVLARISSRHERQLARDVGGLTMQELCFRAYRQLHRATIATQHEDLVLEPGRRGALLGQARETLVFARRHPGPFVLVCLGLLGIATSDFALAEDSLLASYEMSRGPGRDGALVHLYRLYILSDGRRGRSKRDAFLGLAKRRPAVRWWLAQRTGSSPTTVAHRALVAEVMGSQVPVEEAGRFAQLTLNAMLTELLQGHLESADRLGRGALSWPAARWSEQARSKREEVLTLWSWLGYQAVQMSLGDGEAAAASWLVHSERAATLCLLQGLRRPFEIRAAAALARATLVLRRRSGRRDAATRAIRGLLDPAAIRLAERSAETRAHREGVVATVRLLRSTLARLEIGSTGSSSTDSGSANSGSANSGSANSGSANSGSVEAGSVEAGSIEAKKRAATPR